VGKRPEELSSLSLKYLCGYRELDYTGGRGDIRITKSEIFGSKIDANGIPAKLPAWKIPVESPFQFESATIAGDSFYSAGPLDGWSPKNAVLWKISLADGKKMEEVKLAVPPVFDGLAVANGKLYVSFQDGKLMCFGDQ
jgi:hypothetical protein